ncbi:MAG: 3-hydroxyacyl-CoA dehydrogenase family protein [bacterium]|nr:3-hydroxyacyl-CoA dehydrogenase family protein [bacterium]
MEIKKVGIIGAGKMGSEIALYIAYHGFEVVLKDVYKENLEKGLTNITNFIQDRKNKGRMTGDEADKILSKVKATLDYKDVRDCDMIIESVKEDLDIKREVFYILDNICPENVIFASNTSAIPITKIAAAVKRKDKILGSHFFNPVFLSRLIEVVPISGTSSVTINTVTNFFTAGLKKKIVTSKDGAGFIVNRLLVPFLNEAIILLDEGIATKEEIDRAAQLGMGLPMGPLALMDNLGLDLCLKVADIVHDEYKNERYHAVETIRKMVKENKLGVKTGEGFFKYKTE